MRDQRRPYFEVRPFIGLSELLDEIVASPARVSIRRNGKTEYLIRVNGHAFRMSNRGPKGGNEEQLPALLFQLIDPGAHAKGRQHGGTHVRPSPAKNYREAGRVRYLAPHRADAPLGLLGRNQQWKLFLHTRERGRTPIAADSPVREGDQCALRGIEGQSSPSDDPSPNNSWPWPGATGEKQCETTPTRGDRPRNQLKITESLLPPHTPDIKPGYPTKITDGCNRHTV